MPGFIAHDHCEGDKYKIRHFKTLHDLAVGVSWMRWHANEKGWAAALAYCDTNLENIYRWWMRCVANKDLSIEEGWIIRKGGDPIPSAEDFIRAVDVGPGSKEMDKLKGW